MNDDVKFAQGKIDRMQERLDWLKTHNPEPVLRRTRHGSYMETAEQRITALTEAIVGWTQYRDACKQRPTQGKRRLIPDDLIPDVEGAHWECCYCMLRTWDTQVPTECQECGGNRFNRIADTPFERTYRGHTE